MQFFNAYTVTGIGVIFVQLAQQVTSQPGYYMKVRCFSMKTINHATTTPKFKICYDTRYKVLLSDTRIADKNFPANSIMTEYNGVIYVCDHFPNFKGDARKALLKIWVYDKDDISPEWVLDIIGANSRDKFESTLARKIWIAHLENNHSRTHRVRQNREPDFSRMMKDVTTRKKGSGSGSRLIPGVEERDFGPELDWREHSIYAHWEFRGNASMVAISARYDQNR